MLIVMEGWRLPKLGHVDVTFVNWEVFGAEELKRFLRITVINNCAHHSSDCAKVRIWLSWAGGALANMKMCIFKNWLKTHPKWQTCKTCKKQSGDVGLIKVVSEFAILFPNMSTFAKNACLYIPGHLQCSYGTDACLDYCICQSFTSLVVPHNCNRKNCITDACSTADCGLLVVPKW